MKNKYKTLHLNLIRKWFDMILSGEKKEEYREITPYWCSRFLLVYDEVNQKHTHYPISWWRKVKVFSFTKSFEQTITDNLNKGFFKFKPCHPITFSNGYKTNRPQILTPFLGIKIATGKEKWGAVKDRSYFVLSLGKSIFIHQSNIKQS